MPGYTLLALLVCTFQLFGVIWTVEARAETAPKSDPVVRALRQDAEKDQVVLNQACDLLRRAGESQEASAVDRQRLLTEIAAKLREKNPAVLQARGDAARLGLYGLPKNLKQALHLYTQAAEAPSPESGYNAALLLYLGSRQTPEQATARRILNLLQKSTISNYNVKGSVAAQAHYLAADIYARGLTGRKDLGKAFLHYRVSARNGYVPGVYHYLQMLSRSIAKLSEEERDPHVREMRMLASRWKWSSPEIMRQMGDLHAAGWVADKDGFFAQYHWRIAERMNQASETSKRSQEVFKSLPDPAMESRLQKAVEAALQQNRTPPKNYALEFADVCS